MRGDHTSVQTLCSRLVGVQRASEGNVFLTEHCLKGSFRIAKMKSVGVVGGGIIGLATVEALLEEFTDLSFTVYSSAFTPDTTADVSAGWIYPYLTGKDENQDDLAYWTNRTIDHLVEVSKESGVISTAISPVCGYFLYKKGPVTFSKSDDKCFPGRRLVSQDEIRRLTDEKYEGGMFISTWSCDCSIYLPYVMEKLKRRGVKFIKEKINSLDDLAERGHDIVVNSAGYFSKFLTKDTSAHPIRGQVIVVRAPWIKNFVIEEDGDSYILPRRDTVIVGGTHTPDDSVDIDSVTAERLWDDACKMYPRLREATIVRHAAGIRPGRTKIRMEVEKAITGNGTEYVVLHHYGHGGSGVTIHWGCAKQAAGILKRYLTSQGSQL